jgi:hypothetical protein
MPPFKKKVVGGTIAEVNELLIKYSQLIHRKCFF